MPAGEPAKRSAPTGIHVGDVGGNATFSALGDIVGGDKVTTITTTIQISVEAVTQRPLVTTRLWDAPTATDRDTREDILLLAELAAATAGMTLETVGQAENLKLLAPEQVIASREKIATKFLEPSTVF
jgi:hypothetical protein